MKENPTTAKTKVMAGITTFMTKAYIGMIAMPLFYSISEGIIFL